MINKFFKNSSGSSKGIIILVLTGAVLILANILIKDFTLRWDTTQDKIYSLSDATHSIMDKSTREVTLKYFNNASLIKDTPKEIQTYARRINDLLKEYQAYGKGKIKL